ncbi:hypothetical protein [Paraburkholderia sp. SIMBA_030]|uniref:hypothetical protein n=1 Tax=Paraburkholderia sp. SIMBA_030 TaxID=3085773 RepID=UPI00397A3315
MSLSIGTHPAVQVGILQAVETGLLGKHEWSGLVAPITKSSNAVAAETMYRSGAPRHRCAASHVSGFGKHVYAHKDPPVNRLKRQSKTARASESTAVTSRLKNEYAWNIPKWRAAHLVQCRLTVSAQRPPSFMRINLSRMAISSRVYTKSIEIRIHPGKIHLRLKRGGEDWQQKSSR